MVILSIETSTRVCSAALSKNGVCIAYRIQEENANHIQILPLFIQELLDIARSQSLNIQAIALSEGPGSYTGLRIGTSIAKGLCYGMKVPLVPIPSLEVLSASAQIDHELHPILCPMIDARRMEVYTQLYTFNEQGLLVAQSSVEARVIENNEWLLSAQGRQIVYYFGDGAEKCQTLLESDTIHYLGNVLPNAYVMGALALQRLTNEQYTPIDIAYYEPFYLKEYVAAQSHVKGLK